jgi:hypothetical protein
VHVLIRRNKNRRRTIHGPVSGLGQVAEGRGIWSKPLKAYEFIAFSLVMVTLGSRPEVRYRGTMSKRVTANVVEVVAETLARDLRRNCKRRAGCRHNADQNGGGRSGGDGPAACNPVDREGDGNRGCISVFRY